MRRSRLIACVWAVVASAGAVQAATAPATMLLLDAAVTSTVIVAVGERGTILRSANSGHSWQEASSGVFATLTGVSFVPGSSHGWAVGHDAVILASDDAGATWRKSWQGSNLEASLLDVCALDAAHAIAVGAYGLFLETTDGGKSWVQRKVTANDLHFNRLTRAPDGTLYLAGEHGTLLRSTDAGGSWTELPAPYEGSFYGILPLGAHDLLAYGLRGHLYRTANGGETWSPVPVPQPVLIATAIMLKDGTIVLAGESRGRFLSRDGGHSVISWDAPVSTAIAELLEAPDGTLLAVGEAGVSVLPKP